LVVQALQQLHCSTAKCVSDFYLFLLAPNDHPRFLS